MKHISILLLSISMLLLFGCSSKPDYTQLNKENSLKYISSTFEKNKVLNTYKAIAISIDTDGKSVIGYSHDAKSQMSANAIAIDRCNSAKNSTNLDSICSIYAEGDTIVQDIE